MWTFITKHSLQQAAALDAIQAAADFGIGALAANQRNFYFINIRSLKGIKTV